MPLDSMTADFTVAAPSGVQLYYRPDDPAFINEITYLGPTMPVVDAIASIVAYVNIVWAYRNDEWLWYAPGQQERTLYELIQGETLNILVTQDVFWVWPEA